MSAPPLSDVELAQIRALITRPSPTANPPIVIGPFNNVPAPGSPIRSDWPQSIATYVSDNLPDVFVSNLAVGLAGTLPNSTAVVNLGSIAIPASPYPRTIWSTATIGVSTTATAVFEVSIAASSNGSYVPAGRGKDNGTTVTTPPSALGLPANTACTLTAKGSFTTAPGVTGTIIGALSRMDVLVFPISGYRS